MLYLCYIYVINLFMVTIQIWSLQVYLNKPESLQYLPRSYLTHYFGALIIYNVYNFRDIKW